MESKDNRNAILAVVISGIILFGWNYFFAPPMYDTTQAPAVEGSTSTTTDAKTVSQTSNGSIEEENKEKLMEEVSVQTFEFAGEMGSVKVDSKLNILDFNFKNAEKSSLENFTSYKNDFVIQRNGKEFSPTFTFTKVNENQFKINDANLNLSGTLNYNENGSLDITVISTEGFTPKFKVTSVKIENEDDERKSNSFLYYGDGLEQVIIGNDDKDYSEFKFKWFGLDYDYHLLGYVVDSSKIARIDYNKDQLVYRTIEPTNELNYKVIYAKKVYDDLHSLGHDLEKAVDFGMMAIIAVPILRGLQYLFDLTQNYGLAIILLTIVIRFATFPLQYKSFKSMKKMQVIQPELQKIREKHKENPQKMQQETMALFKKSGANPLSGCLPMLAQMPIFFAFYQVLFTSTELVGAPFYFWISDLSLKDPFYILPVLMGLAMFLNMKLTPSTSADPMQQKMMMMMPVIFSLFMLNLPSGLTLYILISTLVGMGQQLFVYRRTA